MKINKLFKLSLTVVMILSLTTPMQANNNGWIFNDGTWNYKSDGIALTGWHQIDNNWYAFDETGKMNTGWTASDEKWYFMGESGVMQSDAWVNDLEGSKYFIKGTGVMATDYVKDGYELDSSGKAVFMTQTTSVELTEYMDINNKVIEGNLYIDTAKFKELELNGITVTGKLVIMGEEIHDAKITIKDSIINTISSQTRGAEMTLAGTTSVTNIQIEENSAIKPAADYTGKVENIEVQSTAQKEVKIEVPAKTVSSNTFAAVTVNAKVDNLSVNKKTDLTVNADIKNVTVNKSATDTKVEVSKGNTVGAIEAEAKVEVGGSGNVDKVTGAGKDESIVTPKPEKPSGGGGNSDSTPPIQVPDGLGVSTEAELINALKNTSIQEIYLKNDIEITRDTDVATNKIDFTLNLNRRTINGNASASANKVTVGFNSGTTLVKNGRINALTGTFCTIRVRNEAIVNLENMILYNETKNGNSIKASGSSVVNISNTTSTSVNGGGMEATGGTINVNENNTFTQTGSYDHNSTIGAASNGGTLNINSGMFSNGENYGLFVFNSGGTINVHGGTFSAGEAVLKADKSTTGDTSIINIFGGMFDGEIQIAEGAILNITGGTFIGKFEIKEGAILNITGGTFKNTDLTLEKFMPYVVVGYKAVENEDVFTVVADTNPVSNLEELTESEEVGNEIVVENQDTIGENIN